MEEEIYNAASTLVEMKNGLKKVRDSSMVKRVKRSNASSENERNERKRIQNRIASQKYRKHNIASKRDLQRMMDDELAKNESLKLMCRTLEEEKEKLINLLIKRQKSK